MSIVSKKRRQAKRMKKEELSPKLLLVHEPKAPAKKKVKITLKQLLARQKYNKNRKKVFRHERAQQKPILEAAKKKAEREAKRKAREEKLNKRALIQIYEGV